MSVLPTTSHICAKEGRKDEHVLKKLARIATSLDIWHAHLPFASPTGPEKVNHTPRYRTASVGSTKVIGWVRKTPSLSKATKVSGAGESIAGEVT